MTPLHSYLLARPLKMERHIGDILLPDIAVEESQDALIEQVGPGRVLNNGARYPVQARPGDRCVYQKFHVRTEVDGAVLLDDKDLVALIPGPDHAEMFPANDYVFVVPDPVETVRPSGVLVATTALKSGSTRELERRNELIITWLDLRDRWEREGYPLDERLRLVHRWAGTLTAGDKRLMQEALKDGVEDALVSDSALDSMRALVNVPRPCYGRLQAVGPGAVGPDGRRKSLESALGPILETGRCVWANKYAACELFSAGERVLAIRAQFLEAALED